MSENPDIRLGEQGQEIVPDGYCRECHTDIGAGYLCDDCDTVEGWPDPRYVSTANTGNTVTVYHLREDCSCLHDSETRLIDRDEIDNRNLELCGQCDRLHDDTPDTDPPDQDHSAYMTLRDAEEDSR